MPMESTTFGLTSADFGPMSTKFGPKSAKFDQHQPGSDQHWRGIHQSGPISVNFAPLSTSVGLRLTKLDPNWPGNGKISADFHQVWPAFGQIWTHVRPKFCRHQHGAGPQHAPSRAQETHRIEIVEICARSARRQPEDAQAVLHAVCLRPWRVGLRAARAFAAVAGGGGLGEAPSTLGIGAADHRRKWLIMALVARPHCEQPRGLWPMARPQSLWPHVARGP